MRIASPPTLRVDDAGEGVWDVRLARPNVANALTQEQLEYLSSLLTKARAAGARVLVFSGDGENFSAGMDFSALTGRADDDWIDEALDAFHQESAAAPLLTIGAVHGACIGAAFDLVLAMDLVVAEQAAFFQLPAARFGLLYRERVVRTLVHRGGTATALRILALGARLDAHEARDARIATEVVESGSAHSRALTLAREVLEQNIWEAVTATKGLIRSSDNDGEQREHWDAVRRRLTRSPARLARVAAAQERHIRVKTVGDPETGRPRDATER
jgi:enoyl-CoA hydratase/carnithine racemase